MANWKKLASGAAGAAGAGGGLNVEDVFSTYLYHGTGYPNYQTITNGIDLAGEGGLIWTKGRTANYPHHLVDTERGVGYSLETNNTNASTSKPEGVVNFYNDGYRVYYENEVNNGDHDYVSWTFRKAPKFFDVVTYTGNGVAGREIAHNLGCDVGFITIKRLDASGDWRSWLRLSDTTSTYTLLNGNYQGFSNQVDIYGDDTTEVRPTSSVFTIGSNTGVNASGGTYVAYLFAHNDGDGEFGPTGDQDIIKCGSFTTDSSGVASVDLGWEPQFIITKRTDGTSFWLMFDNMRGLTNNVSSGDKYLAANLSNAEVGATQINLSATGFETEANNWATNANHFYIAIRRGPMAVPESASDVFAMDTFGGTTPNPPEFVSGFPVDLGVYKVTTTTGSWVATPRLTQGNRLRFDRTSSEDAEVAAQFDYMNGYYDGTSVLSQFQGWMWRRAPSFFDVVAYTGDGVAGRTVSHNLGVAPEMMWIKRRTGTDNWRVYHKDIGNSYALYLNDRSPVDGPYSVFFNNTSPTDTEFTLGTDSGTNFNGNYYIAYLFASLDGVSKVGSYTGDGTSGRVIDCGFTNGARFVLIKKTSASGYWMLFDVERGITSTANDGVLALNETFEEYTETQFAGYDMLQPHSSGFMLTSGNDVNYNGHEFIFYAIA
jgi:hypothetical protein